MHLPGGIGDENIGLNANRFVIGWRMQAAFHRIGIVDNNPDILSLDEPTRYELSNPNK